MYNRYIRNDRGTYTCVPEEDRPFASSAHHPPSPNRATQANNSQRPGPSGPEGGRPKEHWNGNTQCGQEHPPVPSEGDGISGILRRLLDRFHLENVDTGDILLLFLLFLLFEEEADEELLFALGLLLVL